MLNHFPQVGGENKNYLKPPHNAQFHQISAEQLQIGSAAQLIYHPLGCNSHIFGDLQIMRI